MIILAALNMIVIVAGYYILTKFIKRVFTWNK